MTKTILMLTALGGVFLLGTACAGLFTKTSDQSESSKVAACAGLSGQAKVECEQRQAQ
jgi:hypothetical protein